MSYGRHRAGADLRRRDQGRRLEQYVRLALGAYWSRLGFRRAGALKRIGRVNAAAARRGIDMVTYRASLQDMLFGLDDAATGLLDSVFEEAATLSADCSRCTPPRGGEPCIYPVEAR